jgi:hypothetical protein
MDGPVLAPMIHPSKKPTSVDATNCPITRFREPVCHSCFTSVHVVRNLLPLEWLVESSSAYEEVALGCTADCTWDDDMVCGLRCKQGSSFGLCEAEVRVILREEETSMLRIPVLFPTRMPSPGRRLHPLRGDNQSLRIPMKGFQWAF